MPFEKGHIPWNRDIKAPQIASSLKGKSMTWVSEANKNRIGSHYNLTNGYKKTYSAVHKWVARNFGSPKFCENCKKIIKGKGIHWSNISGFYLRDRSDWKRLCAYCHAQEGRTSIIKNYFGENWRYKGGL